MGSSILSGSDAAGRESTGDLLKTVSRPRQQRCTLQSVAVVRELEVTTPGERRQKTLEGGADLASSQARAGCRNGIETDGPASKSSKQNLNAVTPRSRSGWSGAASGLRSLRALVSCLRSHLVAVLLRCVFSPRLCFCLRRRLAIASSQLASRSQANRDRTSLNQRQSTAASARRNIRASASRRKYESKAQSCAQYPRYKARDLVAAYTYMHVGEASALGLGKLESSCQSLSALVESEKEEDDAKARRVSSTHRSARLGLRAGCLVDSSQAAGLLYVHNNS